MYCLCASVEMTAYSFMVVLGLGGVFWDFVKRMGTGLYERTFAGQYAWELADYSPGKHPSRFSMFMCAHAHIRMHYMRKHTA